jgi:hypothetical protein
MSRHRRQQRKRARRHRVRATFSVKFLADFDDFCKAMDEGFRKIRELTIGMQVSAFERRLRKEAREQDEARRVG